MKGFGLQVAKSDGKEDVTGMGQHKAIGLKAGCGGERQFVPGGSITLFWYTQPVPVHHAIIIFIVENKECILTIRYIFETNIGHLLPDQGLGAPESPSFFKTGFILKKTGTADAAIIFKMANPGPNHILCPGSQGAKSYKEIENMFHRMHVQGRWTPTLLKNDSGKIRSPLKNNHCLDLLEDFSPGAPHRQPW